MNRIRNKDDLDRQLRALLAAHPSLTTIADQVGEVPLRLRQPGLAGLAEIVISQQVSKQSAAAMLGRLKPLIDPLSASNLLKLGNAPMIEAGLSRAKQATLIAIAERMEKGQLDLEGLCAMPVREAQQVLVEVKGIGPWTAEVFLLFCAGHADIFPAGDIALQQAVGDFFGLGERPDEKRCRVLVQSWSPFRGAAARLMWAYYSHLKGGRGVVPV